MTRHHEFPLAVGIKRGGGRCWQPRPEPGRMGRRLHQGRGSLLECSQSPCTWKRQSLTLFPSSLSTPQVTKTIDEGQSEIDDVKARVARVEQLREQARALEAEAASLLSCELPSRSGGSRGGSGPSTARSASSEEKSPSIMAALARGGPEVYQRCIRESSRRDLEEDTARVNVPQPIVPDSTSTWAGGTGTGTQACCVRTDTNRLHTHSPSHRRQRVCLLWKRPRNRRNSARHGQPPKSRRTVQRPQRSGAENVAGPSERGWEWRDAEL